VWEVSEVFNIVILLTEFFRDNKILPKTLVVAEADKVMKLPLQNNEVVF
jgi:hypothetical protein